MIAQNATAATAISRRAGVDVTRTLGIETICRGHVLAVSANRGPSRGTKVLRADADDGTDSAAPGATRHHRGSIARLSCRHRMNMTAQALAVTPGARPGSEGRPRPNLADVSGLIAS